MKRLRKTAFEQDALTPWHKVLAMMSRAGVRKKAKRQCNRRERREGKDNQ